MKKRNFILLIILSIIALTVWYNCTPFQGTRSGANSQFNVLDSTDAARATIISTPTNLLVPPMASDDSSITVIWSKASDSLSNPAASYNVYQNGVKVASTPNMYYNATGLSAGSSYSFTVSAVSADGTESAASGALTASTSPAMQVFNVTSYGAVGDGSTLNTAAIQAAINACTSGGKVLIPSGTFLSGAIYLKSNMTLQIDGTLRGSDNASDYVKSNYRFPYYSSGANYSGLINAYPMSSYSPCTEIDLSTSNANRNTYYGGLTNIRICGKGIVNGASDTVGSITGHNITKLGSSEASAGGDDSDRGDMIACKDVNGLYLGGLTLYNPAMHTIFVSFSKNITMAGINASTYDIHNADGVDLATSDTAYIFGSTWDTGDDCINLNAGQGQEGVTDNYPDQNLRIFDNTCLRGHGGVVFGSFTAAWIKNVLIEDNVFDGTDIGLRCKTGSGNGGGGDTVTFRDCTVKNIQKDAAIFFDSTYAESGYTKAGYGQWKNFTISNINCSSLSKYGIYINGASGAPATNLSLTNVSINTDKKGEYINYCSSSSFNNITVNGSGASTIWSISNATGLTFTGCLPTPAGY